MNTNLRIAVVVLIIALVAGSGTVALFIVSKGSATSTASLPPGCVKPQGGFLIIASIEGYNDSIQHGAPFTSWPMIDVKQGQNVTIVVCDIDHQAHGFQINHYYDANTGDGEVTLQPGQVLRVPTFVATETGDFTIYCDIPCSIHIYMQSGLLNVTSSA